VSVGAEEGLGLLYKPLLLWETKTKTLVNFKRRTMRALIKGRPDKDTPGLSSRQYKYKTAPLIAAKCALDNDVIFYLYNDLIYE